MSALKNQLRIILPSLSEEANRIQDKEIKRRFYLIKAVVDSRRDVKMVCESRGVSTDFFYEWGRRLLKGKTLKALSSRSRKPKRSPNQTSKRIEKRVRRLRTAEPSYGPERISFYLKKLYNMVCPVSTVYAILLRLKLITEPHKKRLTKKHLKRYTRPFPGYLQMDIKYVPYPIQGLQYYEFNAVDHHSSWRLTRAYRNKSYESLNQFLRELSLRCPFLIVQVQTDNGMEFTDKYHGGNLQPTGLHPLDLWCSQRGIEHRLIPIGQKELNGKVENTHKQDDREFYARYLFENFESLERNMTGYNEHWNSARRTKKLGWKTPEEVIEWAVVRALAMLTIYARRYPLNLPQLVEWTSQGNAYLSVPAVQKSKLQTKPKKLSALNRYLQYLEWDEKKRLKAILPVPVISQNFSVFQNFKFFRRGSDLIMNYMQANSCIRP